MAQVAVAIANRNGAAIFATRRIALEAGELLAASRRAAVLFHLHGHARTFESIGVDRTVGQTAGALAYQDGTNHLSWTILRRDQFLNALLYSVKAACPRYRLDRISVESHANERFARPPWIKGEHRLEKTAANIFVVEK